MIKLYIKHKIFEFSIEKIFNTIGDNFYNRKSNKITKFDIFECNTLIHNSIQFNYFIYVEYGKTYVSFEEWFEEYCDKFQPNLCYIYTNEDLEDVDVDKMVKWLNDNNFQIKNINHRILDIPITINNNTSHMLYDDDDIF